MAAIPPFLPLTNLCQNIETATKTVGVILNPQLQVVPGKRYETNLNSVLKAILNRLEDEPPTGKQSPQILTTLNHDVTDFTKKITDAKKVARRETQLDESLITKIDLRVTELLNDIRGVCHAERQQLEISEQRRTYPSFGRMTHKDFVTMVVSEVCVFKAAHHMDKTAAAYLQYYDQVSADGCRVIFEYGQERLLYPQKYLDLPGPLFLLLCRLCFSICSKEPHDSSVSQKFIPLFLRASLQFPEQKEAINGIITSLRVAESRTLLGQRVVSLIKTIREIQKYS